MVKNDILRQSAKHHHSRRHRNNSRRVEPGHVNSHIQDSTRDDNQHKQHDGENPRKERDTKMAKRTKKILGGLAVLILSLFVVGTSVRDANAADRDQRRDEARDNIRAEDREDGLRFSGRQIRFVERAVRVEARLGDRLQREADTREFRVERRGEIRDESRTFNRTESRFQRDLRENRRQGREDFARTDRAQERMANQFTDRVERNFAAQRESRFRDDSFLGRDREYRRTRADR